MTKDSEKQGQTAVQNKRGPKQSGKSKNSLEGAEGASPESVKSQEDQLSTSKETKKEEATPLQYHVADLSQAVANVARGMKKLETEVAEIREGVNAFADSDASPAVEALIRSRFEQVKFSPKGMSVSETARGLVTHVEKLIEAELPDGREKALAMTHLEDVYMRINRACRDLK